MIHLQRVIEGEDAKEGGIMNTPYLREPYAQTPLRCVEHHRQRQLVGYCLMCVLRRINEDLRETCYGARTAESHLLAIRDIIERLRATQVMAALCATDVSNT